LRWTGQVEAGSDEAVLASRSGKLSDETGTVVIKAFRLTAKRQYREASVASKRPKREGLNAAMVLADQAAGKKKPDGVGLTTQAGEIVSQDSGNAAGYVDLCSKNGEATETITLHYLDMFRLQLRARGVLKASDLGFENYTMSSEVAVNATGE